MPREKIKRGRRALPKGKRESTDGLDEGTSLPKRRKVELDDTPWSEDEAEAEYDEEHAGHVEHAAEDHEQVGDERPFYGLLDEQEQEYFKRADNLLDAGQFADQDEKVLLSLIHI